MKIASLVTGILSLLLCFVPLVGMILGIVAVCAARASEEERKIEGMAAAGMACGIIGLSLGAIVLGATGCTMVIALN